MLCVETKHGLNINQCRNYLFSTIKGSFIFPAKFVRTSIAVGCGLMFILKLVESLWNLTTKPQEIIIKLLVINSSSFLNKTKIYKFNFQTIPSFLSNSFLYFLSFLVQFILIFQSVTTLAHSLFTNSWINYKLLKHFILWK